MKSGISAGLRFRGYERYKYKRVVFEIVKTSGALLSSITIFIVSLIGAYVTFGLLESSGAIKDEKIQLGGAAAGFVVLFYMLSSFYKTQNVEDLQFVFEFPEEHIPNFNEKINGKWELLYDGKRVDGGDILLEKILLGGYAWTPPVKIEPKHSIFMELVEDNNGTRWVGRSSSYYPVKMNSLKGPLNGGNQ